MSLILSGTDGLSDVDGTAATPAIRGTDTNTGIFFPAADTIAFAEGGVESARFDSNGRLGLGTTSPATQLNLSSTTPPVVRLQTPTTGSAMGIDFFYTDSGSSKGGLTLNLGTAESRLSVGESGNSYFQTFYTNGTERMRIDSSGNVVLQARTTGTGQLQVGNSAGTMPNGYAVFTGNSDSPYPIVVKGLSGSQGMIGFFDTSNNVIGSVAKASSSVQYLTSSDYRLKNDVVPMAGALGKVSQLKPVTYKWKSDDSNGQGFIAHELAEVFPDAVSGEKDAVDEEGNIKPQGIDTSFLVATLTAAIQELKIELDTVKAELATLKA